MFLAKLAEAASSALMYLQQYKGAGQRWRVPGDNNKSLGWTLNPAVSPEAVLSGVLHGLPVHVGLAPFWLKWQHFLHKVNEEV